MRTAFKSLWLPAFALLACNASAVELRTVATTPSNGLEGIDVAQDGSIYLTNATAHVIHKVDTAGHVSEFANIGAAVQVILSTSTGFIATAQERDPDFSVMLRPSPTAATPRGFTAGDMGKLGAELFLLDKKGKVVRTIRGPDGAFFNGIARLGKNFLIADSALGTIWIYETGADQVATWFKNDALLGPNGRFPGANGIKVLKDTVYISNTAAGKIYQLKTAQGRPTGELAEFANVASPDDFDVTKSGDVYLPSEGKVLRISQSGQITELFDNCKGCDSALLTDHERSLLLVTHGFGPDAGPGRLYSLSLAPSTSATAAKHCDRTCMRTVLDQYLDAVFAHDPAKAPLAKNARSTENAVEVAKGDGVWRTMTGLGVVQRRYFDTNSEQAVYYGTLMEGNEPDIVSLRVKILDGLVTEAEWTIARKEYGGMFAPSDLAAMPPPPDTPIPEDQRTSRTELIAAADAYFDGLKLHDGSKVPHIDGCERIENGVKVTNRDRSQPMPQPPGSPPAGAPNLAQEARSGDCASGFEGFAKTIADTTHRRYVVDEEAGVVLGATLFHRPPGVTIRRNLLSEFFWEQRGKISAIYAAMFYLDPSAPDTPGW